MVAVSLEIIGKERDAYEDFRYGCPWQFHSEYHKALVRYLKE